MMILMAEIIFTEPDVDVDADNDAEVMLNWEIRLLCREHRYQKKK